MVVRNQPSANCGLPIIVGDIKYGFQYAEMGHGRGTRDGGGAYPRTGSIRGLEETRFPGYGALVSTFELTGRSFEQHLRKAPLVSNEGSP